MSDTTGEQPFNWGLTPDPNAPDRKRAAAEPAAPEPVEPPVDPDALAEIFAPEFDDEPAQPVVGDAADAWAATAAAAGGAFASVPEPFVVSELPTAPTESYGEDLSHWTAPTPAVPDASTVNDTGRIPAGEAGFAGVGESAVAKRPTNTNLLWWVTGGLIALVVVVALFFFGSQIPKWISGGGAATPTPTAPVTPTAIATPGVVAWDQLYGGECLEPFTSPWAEDFTVVDCATAHAAQLVYRGTFEGDATTAFPGEDALGAQINALCTRNGIFDTTAASAFSTLQVQGAYPVTAEQWDGGQRSYYCFVNTSDGAAITGSLAGAGPQ